LGTPAFDPVAGTYDAVFTHTPIGRALRELVWLRLGATFQPSQRVLDIGCGTGEDALRLAGTGVCVVGTDASSQMIEVARKKALGLDPRGRVEFRCLPMEQIGAGFEGETFDGVLSNFGAVNCAEDLPALVSAVAARLAPGAPLLWVVMGRYVPWEWLWYLFRGEWRKALRRLQPGGVTWRGTTVRYPTPAQMRSLLCPYFSVRRITPLGFALPPSYAAAWLARSPRALRYLTRLEMLAQDVGPLASVADHYIVEAARLPAESRA
jgi:SAM-dependent methyltransferase